MRVGKLLREKYGFNNRETIDAFIDQFAYSENIVRAILNDRYPVLLTCHIQDLSLFTGVSEEELTEAMEIEYPISPLRVDVPMGKPYKQIPPVIAKIDLSMVPEESQYLHADLVDGKPTLVNQHGQVITPSPEDLIPTPISIDDLTKSRGE